MEGRLKGAWRWLPWLPLLSPLTAGFILLLWPAAWWPYFGKEMTCEHQCHLLLASVVVLFFARYLLGSPRLPGYLLFAIGSLVVLAEETDYGLLYLSRVSEVPDLENQSFHNTSVGIVLFLALPLVFAVLPFLFSAASTLRQRWFPVPRATAASVGVCLAFLLLTQLTDAAIDDYLIREGADEMLDLGVTLALLVTALLPASVRLSERSGD
jgi:hypothetical protein